MKLVKLKLWGPPAFVFICISHFSHAMTLDDYNRQWNELVLTRNRLAAELAPWEQQMSALALAKSKVIKRVDALVDSGIQVQSHLKAGLIQLREEGWRVNRITEDYLNVQKELNEKYATLVREFVLHYQTALEHEHQFNLVVDQIAHASSNAHLVQARQQLDEIYLGEENRHSFLKLDASSLSLAFRTTYHAYEKKIEKHRSFVVEFQYPQAPNPTKSIEHLEGMILYLDKRYDTYLGHLTRLFSEIDQKGNQLILKELEIWDDLRATQEKQYQSSMDFLSLVHEIIHDLGTVMNEATSASYIHGAPLLPEYNAYQGILTYQATCKNLAEMRTKNSPFYNGCVLLTDLFKEAKDFMATDGWLKLGGSLSYMTDLPPEFASRKAKLRKLKTQSRSGGASLLEAIQLNDSIILEWNQMNTGDV